MLTGTLRVSGEAAGPLWGLAAALAVAPNVRSGNPYYACVVRNRTVALPSG